MKGNDKLILGIDLGTTNTVFATSYVANGKTFYNVLQNGQGGRLMRSVVAFSGEDDNAEVLIGQPAVNQQIRNPKRTIYGSKRLIGAKYDDKDVKKLFQNAPFRVVKRGKGSNETDYFADIQIEENRKKKIHHPEEIEALILGEVKQQFEQKFGRPPDSVVITVPAYFNDIQRNATLDAAKIAGFKEYSLANEPTAAAVAFQQKCELTDATVLVFDFGGGTLDCSLIKVDKKEFQVLAVSGNTSLGGEDLDAILVKEMINRFYSKTKENPEKDYRAMTLLRQECEKAKKQLSSTKLAEVYIQSFYKNLDLREKISRAEFENLADDYFSELVGPIETVIEDAGIESEEITHVIMVGGSSHIPCVKDVIKDFFDGRLEPLTTVDPDEAVALGAAIICDNNVNGGEFKDSTSALKASNSNKTYIRCVETQPFSIGVLSGRKNYKKFIERGKSLPQEKVFNFTTIDDFKTTATIQIIQGEDEDEEVNLKDRDSGFLLIKKFDLEGIPSKPKGQVTIKIKLKIDKNGVLNVSATCVDNGATKDIDIEVDKALKQDDINNAVLTQEIYMERKKFNKLVEQYNNFLEGNKGKSIFSECQESLKEFKGSVPEILDNDVDHVAQKYDELSKKVESLKEINIRMKNKFDEIQKKNSEQQ